MEKHSGNKVKQLKLSNIGKVAALMTLSSISSTAMAQIDAADGSLVQVSQQNGVDVINIEAPNASGLSHNRFNDYNVSKQGAVLNNALKTGTSTLAGDLGANQNLSDEAASVILNEVISLNPSLLLGKQEIFGMAADFVLANPNGISCNDCGFINTPRASLVVGTPTIEDEQLAGFDVTNGNQLTVDGVIDADAVLNLIAPSIKLDGDLSTSKSVNVIMGSSTIEFGQDGELVSNSVQNEQVLDGRLLGSIKSGRINIHSTDTRATVEASALALEAEQVGLVAGNLTIGGEVETVVDGGGADSNPYSRSNVDDEDTNGSITKENFTKSSIKASDLNIKVDNKLEISGAVIEAASTTLSGGSVDIAAKVTTNSGTADEFNSKGQWHDSKALANYNQTVHATSIDADSLSITATESDINASAANVDADSVLLTANGSVNLSGELQKYGRTAIHDFKNEGGRLKTGSTLDELLEDTYKATTVDTNKLVIIAKEDVDLAGVTANTSNTVITAKNVKLGVEQSNYSSKKVHQETYWGRLFGAKAEKDVLNKETQNATVLNSENDVLIFASEGLTIEGSKINSQGSSKVSAGTDINIVSVQEMTETIKANRKGSLFDITEEEQENWTEEQANQASELHAQVALEVVTQDKINIVGSDLVAAGMLTLGANDIDISAGEENTSSTSSQVGWEEPTYSINDTDITDIDASVNGIIDLIKKKKSKIGAGIGLEFFDKKKSVDKSEAVGSNISGGSVVIGGAETDSVDIIGSDIEATVGDVTIGADDVTVGAGTSSTVTEINDTTVGISIDVEIGKDGAGNDLGIDISNTSGTTTATDAEVSSISAANGTVDIDASTISHEGTDIDAAAVEQDADEISQDAAVSTVVSDIDQVDVSIGIDLDGKFKGGVSAGVTIDASGSNTKKEDTTATVTDINADEIDITVGGTLTDEGTNYGDGDGDVTIIAGDYDNSAAENTSSEVSHSAGVGVGVSVGTDDMVNVDVDGEVSASYQLEDSDSSEAVQSNIDVDNITIDVDGSISSEANINANEGVNLSGDSIDLSQAEDTSSSVSGGFDLEVGGGASVSVASGVVTDPSVDVSASANGGNSSSTTGVAAEINAGNVTIDADGDVNLEGVNIDADGEVNISGDEVNISGTTESTDVIDVEVGVGVDLSKNITDIDVSGNVGVEYEDSEGGQDALINGATINIDAIADINLSGAQLDGDTVVVDSETGDLNVEAINNTSDKVNVSADIGLSGKIGDKATIDGGEGSVNVEVVDSSTYTDSGITGDNVTINVNDANLVGSTIEAGTLEGEIAGTLTTGNVVESETSTKVDVAIEAGKGSKDSKLGFDGSLTLDAEHKNQVGNQIGGINAENDNIVIADSDIDTSAADEANDQINVGLELSTDLGVMKDKVIADIKKGELPLVDIEVIELESADDAAQPDQNS